MPSGVVLREALKFERVAATILYDQSRENEMGGRLEDKNLDAKQSGEGVFWQFFSWIDGGAFEVSTDAFTTFRVCFVAVLRKPLTQGLGNPHETQANGGPLSRH